MPILLTADQISKTFGANPLFTDLSFGISTGDRIGLIGANGAGKSTLLKILAGEETVDEGDLARQRGLRVVRLAQVPRFEEGATVGEALDLENAPSAGAWAARLELSQRIWEPVAELSGGWKKRVAFAQSLSQDPDLLLLDEPTNHLDLETILELEDLIQNLECAVLTVTHDRAFLDRVSKTIWELDKRYDGGLWTVQGNYTNFIAEKEIYVQGLLSREASLRNTLRRETEWLRQGAKARTTKQQARINRAGDLKDEVADLSSRNMQRKARIDFDSDGGSGTKKLLEAKGIAKSLGGRTLFKGLDLLLAPGTRLGLLGPNGCGKSTLIRTLLGEMEPDAGEVRRAQTFSVAYFEQNRESLDPETTLLRAICPTGDSVTYRGERVHAKGYLDRFLFRYEQMAMPVGKLSGGEQARLLLAKLMLEDCNVLVLDEPTNDLDMETLAVLEDCLADFPGAVILVTHDRAFLDAVANRILCFTGGGEITAFASVEQWEKWQRGRASEARTSKSKAKAAASATGRRKLTYKDQRELDGMEATIARVEAELAALTSASVDPKLATNAVELANTYQQMQAKQTEIERLYARWQELSGD